MMILILGTAIVAGIGIGWYGHKAELRIAAWGHRADEQDLIFKQMNEGEGQIWSADARRLENTAIGVTLMNTHYPPPAASK